MFFSKSLKHVYLKKTVSSKTWRVLPLTTLFHRKRDALLLLQLCFAENVTRFTCFKSVSSKTWRILPVTSLFYRKRDAFYLLQDFSAKTWRVLLPQKYFSKKLLPPN